MLMAAVTLASTTASPFLRKQETRARDVRLPWAPAFAREASIHCYEPDEPSARMAP